MGQPVALVIGAGDATGGHVAERFAVGGYTSVITRRPRKAVQPFQKQAVQPFQKLAVRTFQKLAVQPFQKLAV